MDAALAGRLGPGELAGAIEMRVNYRLDSPLSVIPLLPGSDGMDHLRSFGIIVPAGVMWCECQRNQEESEMNATTVAVDLAKNVFQLAWADQHWKMLHMKRTLLFSNYEQRLSLYVDDAATRLDGLLVEMPATGMAGVLFTTRA